MRRRWGAGCLFPPPLLASCCDLTHLLCAPQGHLRLVLLPIVYNAMAQKETLRALPLFAALQRAMRASSYDRLLRHPAADPKAACAEGGSATAAPPLFAGPCSLDACAAKYMHTFKEAEETDVSAKRSRIVHSASLVSLLSNPPACMAWRHSSSCCLSAFRPCSAQHDLGRSSGQGGREGGELAAVGELRRELRDFKRSVEGQLDGMSGELGIVKNCIMQLYNVLLPGRFPQQQALARAAHPPRMPPMPAHQAPTQRPPYPPVRAVSALLARPARAALTPTWHTHCPAGRSSAPGHPAGARILACTCHHNTAAAGAGCASRGQPGLWRGHGRLARVQRLRDGAAHGRRRQRRHPWQLYGRHEGQRQRAAGRFLARRLPGGWLAAHAARVPPRASAGRQRRCAGPADAAAGYYRPHVRPGAAGAGCSPFALPHRSARACAEGAPLP